MVIVHYTNTTDTSHLYISGIEAVRRDADVRSF